MTPNGYFTLNSVSAPVRLAAETATFENNCVKTNKDRLTLSAAKCSAESLVSGVCADIHAGSLETWTSNKNLLFEVGFFAFRI